MFTNNDISYKKAIRVYIRSIRRSLTFPEKYVAAQLITNKIITISHVYNAKNIAIFISNDGEIDTTLLIKTLLLMKKCVYLPVLPHSGSKNLLFLRYTLSTPLIRNHLNIYEPQWNPKSVIPIEQLNIIFVPLVAFDNNRNRLGMGGGFYDRILQHWKHQDNHVSIGLAYDFQKIPTQVFPIEIWDIPLTKIITPSHYITI